MSRRTSSKSKRRRQESQGHQDQCEAQDALPTYVFEGLEGAAGGSHSMMQGQGSAAPFNQFNAFAALAASLQNSSNPVHWQQQAAPHFGGVNPPHIPNSGAHNNAGAGEARLQKLEQQLQTMSFAGTTISKVIKRIRREQAQFLTSGDEAEALEYLMECAVMAATADPAVNDSESEEGEGAAAEDVQFDADMNAVRVLALETAEKDRERRRLELRCEFVRGDIMEHEELGESVLLKSLGECQHFARVAKLTLPRCKDGGGCSICDPSQRAEPVSEGAGEPQSAEPVKSGKGDGKKRSGGHLNGPPSGKRRSASSASLQGGVESTARDGQLRAFKEALAELWRLEMDCIKWYQDKSHPYLSEVGCSLRGRLSPLLATVGSQGSVSVRGAEVKTEEGAVGCGAGAGADRRADNSTADQQAAQRRTSAAGAGTGVDVREGERQAHGDGGGADNAAVRSAIGDDAQRFDVPVPESQSHPPLQAAASAVREELDTMKQGLYEQTAPGRLPSVILEAFHRSNPSAAQQLQEGAIIVIDD